MGQSCGIGVGEDGGADLKGWGRTVGAGEVGLCGEPREAGR